MCLMAKNISRVNYKTGGRHQHKMGKSMLTSICSMNNNVRDHARVAFGNNLKGKIVGLGKIAIPNDLYISNIAYMQFY